MAPVRAAGGAARASRHPASWTLGEPFFALRTCSGPVANSTCDHCRSHNSDARSVGRGDFDPTECQPAVAIALELGIAPADQTECDE